MPAAVLSATIAVLAVLVGVAPVQAAQSVRSQSGLVQVKVTVAPPMQTFPWANLVSADAHRLPPGAQVQLPSAPFMVRVGSPDQGTPLHITVEY